MVMVQGQLQQGGPPVYVPAPQPGQWQPQSQAVQPYGAPAPYYGTPK